MTTDTVVLVHGLWVHGLAMAYLRREVARGGYRALSYSYPSVRLTLSQNVERLEHFCRGLAARQLHFVGHSLGGVLVLLLLARARGLPPGRVVLAGAPVGGSQAARRLARLPGGRAALGRSMGEWSAAPRLQPAPARDIGVIAGRMPVGLGRVVAPDLPSPSDGAVSVTETWLPEARDGIVLNVSHSGMLFSRAVAHQAIRFLREGRFDKSKDG